MALQVRRGLAADRTFIAASGEPLLDTDSRQLHFGDGSTAGGLPAKALPLGSAGGDLSGSFPNPTVAKVRGLLWSATAPTANQIPRWNATTSEIEWVTGGGGGGVTSITASTGLTGGTITTSGTIAVDFGSASGKVCEGNDSRLSDARFPTAHAHAASDVTSGTFDIARIPTGSSASTVCIGNDSRLSDARTPTTHSHAISDVTGLQTALDEKQKTITSGTAAPTGGVSGDIYYRYQ